MLKDLDILTYNINGDMVVKMEPNNGTVDGVSNLIQRIIKRIFTIQGSNTYDVNLGGQLHLLFKAITREQAEEFEETFGILLNAITEQLKEEQVPYFEQLSPSERLSDIVVRDMVYDPVFGGFLITLKVITQNNVSHSVII